MIVLGPGSLYTSIMPNLLTEGVAPPWPRADAFQDLCLERNDAGRETEGYTAADHIGALFSNSGERLFDWCLANDRRSPPSCAEKYGKEGAEPVVIDERAVLEPWGWPLRAPVAGWASVTSGTTRTPGARAAAALPRESHTRVYG